MKKAIIRHIILLVLLILGIAFLASCKSKIRYVPVENTKIEYRDRLVKDTSSNTEIHNVKDSVVIKDSIVYILNDKGDVIRKEIYQWKDRYHYSEYLLKQLQARYDSLLSVKEKEAQVPYEVQLPPIEKKVYPKWLVILAIIGGCALGFTGYKVIRLFV